MTDFCFTLFLSILLLVLLVKVSVLYYYYYPAHVIMKIYKIMKKAWNVF